MTSSSIYAAQLAWVLQTLRRLGVRERDVDDAAHELFVVVHRKLPTFERGRPVRPWLFGIAYRIARDYLRSDRRARLRVVPAPDGEAPAGDDVEAQADARARLERVQRALDSLEYQRRAAFVMHDLDGFSVPEISRVLDVPVNTLYSHIRRARQHVLAELRGAPEVRHERG
jgi:RNA polymerase sigma-70 factor (ECF subfamily)